MKVWISAEGYLSIKSETELESFALRAWMKENTFDRLDDKCKSCQNMFLDATYSEKDKSGATD
jgi:hypothetical protein